MIAAEERVVLSFPAQSFQTDLWLWRPNFYPQVWLSGIPGIQNIVETVECWFWNEWFNDFSWC